MRRDPPTTDDSRRADQALSLFRRGSGRTEKSGLAARREQDDAGTEQAQGRADRSGDRTHQRSRPSQSSIRRREIESLRGRRKNSSSSWASTQSRENQRASSSSLSLRWISRLSAVA